LRGVGDVGAGGGGAPRLACPFNGVVQIESTNKAVREYPIVNDSALIPSGIATNDAKLQASGRDNVTQRERYGDTTFIWGYEIERKSSTQAPNAKPPLALDEHPKAHSADR
jgi:hypothetical protein